MHPPHGNDAKADNIMAAVRQSASGSSRGHKAVNCAMVFVKTRRELFTVLTKSYFVRHVVGICKVAYISPEQTMYPMWTVEG